MANRLTGCDIEVHLAGPLDGHITDGLDEAASAERAREVVEVALSAAYPQYTVHVHLDRRMSGLAVNVVGYPDDVEPQDIMEVVDEVLDDPENWVVPSPSKG